MIVLLANGSAEAMLITSESMKELPSGACCASRRSCLSLYYVALPTSNRFPAHLWPDVRKSQTDGLYRNRLFDGKALADVFREIGSGVLPAFATDRQRQFGGLRY